MKVTVITPTTPDREPFNERIRALVEYQDYPFIEHLFDYGDGTIGEKRNRLCEKATGEIIIHFDSDDLYAPDWVSRCVRELQDKICTGLRQFYYHDVLNDKGYLYSYPQNAQPYLGEATLAYYKSHWVKNPHLPIQSGECRNLLKGAKEHSYIYGFVATLTGGNTSSQKNGSFWRPVEVSAVKRLYTL